MLGPSVNHNPIAAAVIKRDQTIVLGGLASLVVVAAIYTIYLAPSYGGMAPAMMLRHDHAGRGGDSFLNLFIMWTVMQVAMMSSTAVPMILMHMKVGRHRHPEQSPVVSTMLFLLGYLLVWAAFSAVLALMQMLMQYTALLSPQMTSTSPWLAGGILMAAGLFQFSKLKQACLSQCRSPVIYFMLEWREGRTGALLMGSKHGVYCVGCCWALMALLFVAGVMNLLWMVIITAFVLIEKAIPRGDTVGRVGGVGMVVWGICLIALA